MPAPDAVVLSVGGGGLLCGVIEGLHRNGLGRVPVIAVETADGPVFWPAEHYHQDYFARNPAQPYCQAG